MQILEQTAGNNAAAKRTMKLRGKSDPYFFYAPLSCADSFCGCGSEGSLSEAGFRYTSRSAGYSFRWHHSWGVRTLE
jgi:hypothetical protein